MAELLKAAFEVMEEFARSDFGPDPAPHWHGVLSVQMAHILIGAALALYRAPALVLLSISAGWMAKELLGDIPNAGGTWLVMADSVADLGFGALGYIIAKKQMEKYRNDQT